LNLSFFEVHQPQSACTVDSVCVCVCVCARAALHVRARISVYRFHVGTALPVSHTPAGVLKMYVRQWVLSLISSIIGTSAASKPVTRSQADSESHYLLFKVTVPRSRSLSRLGLNFFCS